MASKRIAARVVKRPEGTTQVNVNLPADLAEELEAWVDMLNAKPAGPRWTKTDVIRTLVARGLEERGRKGLEP